MLGDPEPSGTSVFVWVKPQVVIFGPTKSVVFFSTCFRRGSGERFYRLQVRFGYPFGHRFATFGNMLGLLVLMRILEGTRVSPRRVDGMSDAPSGGQVKPHLGTESSAKPSGKHTLAKPAFSGASRRGDLLRGKVSQGSTSPPKGLALRVCRWSRVKKM